MRPDGPDADLVVHPAQRLLELGADLPATAEVLAEQLTEPFAADHRDPRPVQLRALGNGIHRHPHHRSVAVRNQRHGADRSPGRPCTVTSGTVATAYRYGVPGVQVVSTYGGDGTDRMSPLWWSTGSSDESSAPRRIT